MAKVKNILRCYAMGIKEISNTFNLSRNTVRKYVRQFMRSGYSLDSLMSISELQLQELFEAKELPDRRQSLRRIELEALLPDYAKRLRRRGVTAALLIRRGDHPHRDPRHDARLRYGTAQCYNSATNRRAMRVVECMVDNFKHYFKITTGAINFAKQQLNC